MQILALPGFLAFFFVSLWVGIRLVTLWLRTRQLPELLMGVGVLGIGPVGFGLVMVAAATASDRNEPSAVAALSALAVAIGAGAKYLFNWRIYHPDSPGAAAAALAGSAALAVAWIGDAATTGFAPASWTQPGWVLVRQAGQLGCLFWGAAEALRWWRRMRRRQAIGLSDPLVANRFLLWAVGAGTAGLGSLVGTVVGLAYGRALEELPALTVAMSLFGLVSAGALWLAFVPPETYKRRVRGKPDAAAPA